MSLNARPPFKHSIKLRGILVKLNDVQGGCKLSLHHGRELYKVLVEEDLQSAEALAPMVGGSVEVKARKDRKAGGWRATSEVEQSASQV